MDTSSLDDAFGHHAWANLRILDVCLELSPEQLQTTVPGTYGTILDTARHLIGADAFYIHRLTRGRYPEIDEDHMDLTELRAAAIDHRDTWPGVLADVVDADEIFEGVNDDGSVTKAAAGIRIAQVLHHGTDHRSQICTALTTLGIEPPPIDLWVFGEETGRVVEVPAPAHA